MSLAFLFKKTWHPSTLQNSERVWIAEQKDAAEKRRIEELTKQVREEQQVRELEEMQAAGGHGPDRKERIDWMYEGPMQSAQDRQAETDEYLLGKEFKMTDKGTSELKKLEETKAPGASFMAPAATSANEAFRRVQEDPLLRMRKARMEAEQAVVNNPVKMGRIRHQLEAELAAKAEKKKAKKEAKKAAKDAQRAKRREKKSKKEKATAKADSKSHHSSSSEDEAAESTNMPGRSSHNHTRREGGRGEPESGRLSYQRRDGYNDGGSSHGARDNRAGNGNDREGDGDSREVGGRLRDQAHDDGGRNRRGGREGGSRGADRRGGRDDEDRRHGHENGNGGTRAGDRDIHRGRGRYSNGRGRRGADGRDSSDGNDEGDHHRRRGSGSGSDRKADKKSESPTRDGRNRSTVGKRGNAEREHPSSRRVRKRSRSRSRSRSKNPAQPAPAPGASPAPAGAAAASGEKRYGLLGAKGGGGSAAGAPLGPAAALLEAKEKERLERERVRNEARHRRAMTPEEKMRRLREMEDDGTRNQELKKQRVEHGRRVDSRADGNGVAAGEGKSGKKETASFLEKMRGDQMDSMGLEERMQRNRHYQQRGADVHNFMARG